MRSRPIGMLVSVLASFAVAAAGAQPGFSASVGVNPTTMGTVGENIALRYSIPPYFTLAAEGRQENLLSADQRFELYGSQVSGDMSRKALIGRALVGAGIGLGAFSVSPYAAFDIESATTYTIVRILESGAGLPEDTSSLMDIRGRELIYGPTFGADMGLSLTAFSLSLGGYFSPYALWSVDLERFMDRVTWPTAGSGITYPVFFWGRRAEALELESFLAGGSLGMGLSLPALKSRFGLSGSARYLWYAGNSIVNVKTDTPYKNYDGVTAPDDLPLQIISATENLNAYTELDDMRIEAGLSWELVFLKDALRLRSAPSIAVSYALIRRGFVYRYLDASPSLKNESWIEQYGFVRFSLSLGI